MSGIIKTNVRCFEKLLEGKSMDDANSRYALDLNVSMEKKKDLQKGQKIMYEGETAYVVTIKPVIVIKTKNAVVCGAIHDHLSM